MLQQKKGVISKTMSYIMAVPMDEESIMDPDIVLERLDNAADFNFEVLEINYDEEEDCPIISVSYLEQTYLIHIFAEEFEMDDLYEINHRFTKANMQVMKHADSGLTTAMEFTSNSQESFHLQLKVLQCLVPQIAGIVDYCSERLLSAVWARMAAESLVPPSPLYLYAVQAVAGDNGDVWLHTHGLNRCGLIELEVLKSDEEHFLPHSSILNAMANQAICLSDIPDEGEPDFIAALPNGGSLVTTWVDWERAVTWYATDMIGSATDRLEDHNQDTGVVYTYLNKKDYADSRFVHLSDIPGKWLDNPLFFVTNKETTRMSDLAKERIDFLRAGLNMKNEVLIKVGLDVDEDKKIKAGANTEHIWFSLEKFEGEFLYGELTQEAYYISEMHKGFKAKIPLRALTDWTIDIDGTIVTPDSAYLLVWE